jgi:hypothetical protein
MDPEVSLLFTGAYRWSLSRVRLIQSTSYLSKIHFNINLPSMYEAGLAQSG